MDKPPSIINLDRLTKAVVFRPITLPEYDDGLFEISAVVAGRGEVLLKTRHNPANMGGIRLGQLTLAIPGRTTPYELLEVTI